MATKGILNTAEWESKYGYTRYVEFAWERTAFDVINQTTTIKWTLTGRGTFTGQVQAAPFTVVIDGDTVYQSTTRIELYAGTQIASGAKTIKHNTDGTKSFAVSVYAAIYSSAINKSGSTTFALDTVGIASITKAPNFNDEANPTIEYYNPVGNAISSLQAAISLTGANPDIEYRDIAITGSSYTFNLTDAERKVLRAATQGGNTRKVRFYLRNVVDGNIYFSWKEVSYTVINAYPSIGISVVDANTNTIALTGNKNTLIKYHSTAVANMTAAAYKEAYIISKYIEYGGNRYTEETKAFTNVENNVFTFVATDSRGNTEAEALTPTMINYIKPTANIDNSGLMDTDGNYALKCGGNYYNASFGAASNTITVQYRYKAQGGSYGAWRSMTVSTSGNTYTATANITGLDYRTAYVFQCQIIDKLNTIQSAEEKIISLPVFHWSENDFVFEVPVSFNAGATGIEIDKNNIEGNLNVDGNVSVGGSLSIGGKALSIPDATAGTWTPTLTSSGAVSSYNVRQGWYSKVGNVVSIGWQIKATINSGYNTTNIAISGAPFTPAYAAFGGGAAHNVYFIAQYNFEGYAIGTDGNITLRGQPCNNTTAVNLNITSTAYYPSGSGNVLTLGGTITYMTNS